MSVRPDVIIVTQTWDGLGLAMLMERQGADVLMAYDIDELEEKDREAAEQCGEGLVDRMPLAKAKKLYQGTGAIWLFDNNAFPKEADALRKAGERVLGTGEQSAKMEKDRDHGAKMAEEVGFDLSDTEEFSDVGKAIAYLEQHKDTAYVCKAQGGDADQTFVPQPADPPAVANEELRGYLAALAEHKDGPKKFILQARIAKGVECFDGETELLTESGWKSFSDTARGERVLSMDPLTGEADYQTVQRVIRRPHNGTMLEYESNNANFCVTPNHRMWAVPRNRRNQAPLGFMEAGTVAKFHRALIQKRVRWNGQDARSFTLPGCTRKNGWRGATAVDSLHIKMEPWLEFLGWFLSEGCTTRRSYTVLISQQKPWNREKIAAVLDRLPFHWNLSGSQHDFRITNKQLYQYLAPLGKAKTKRVPRFVMALPPRQIDVFLDAYLRGDGCVSTQGRTCYLTSSRGMADDLQELILKTGRDARVRQRPAVADKLFPSGVHARSSESYVVQQSVSEPKESCLLKEHWKERVYQGTVFCVEVPPHHLIYVRRRGRAMWCGNCCVDLWVHEGKPLVAFVDLEAKRRLNGDLGELVGCAFDYLFQVPITSPLVRRTAGRFLGRPELKDYTGSVDANVMLVGDKTYWLEACWRFGGYNSTPTLLYGLAKSNIVDILEGWLDGKPLGGMFSRGYAASLTLFSSEHEAGFPVLVPPALLKSFCPYALKSGPAGLAMVGGGKAWYAVGCTVAGAPTAESAGAHAREIASKIAFPNKGHRTDLADTDLATLPLARLQKLRTMGLVGNALQKE